MASAEQPGLGQPQKKFYKKRSFWTIVAILAVIGLAAPKTTSSQTATNTNTEQVSATPTAPATSTPAPAQPKPQEPVIPAEYKSALAKANSYASVMHMSKQGVYDQLVSEYGEKFKPEAAQYAIDNVKADWKANALAKAKTYQSTMHMSPAAIGEQLVSQYGEKFVQAEADYAIQHLND